MTDFEQLKEICRVACHERNACKEGFSALMQTESIPQIMQVWKANWDDVFRSRYSDIMVKRLTELSPSTIEEMRNGGVYVNEDSERGYVIICNSDRPVSVGGTARAYIFTPAEVTATENAQVYCRTEGSKITLREHAYAHVENKGTSVEVYNFAKADGVMQCNIHNAAEVVMQGGVVCDYGHRRIAAYGGTKVYSDATKGIELGGQSRKYPLSEHPNANDNANENEE